MFAGPIFQPFLLLRFWRHCESIPSESGWIINAHILFFTDGEIIWDGFFLSSQWIHQLFKVSILSPDMAPVEWGADQDSWHTDIAAMTLRRILNPACINTYSVMLYTCHIYITRKPCLHWTQLCKAMDVAFISSCRRLKPHISHKILW